MNRLEQTMEDMEILKKIVNDEIDIKSVEYCQKKRILDICKQELVKLKILVPDQNYAKLAYCYKEIYDVFVGKE